MAPIILFVYKRIDYLEEIIASLKKSPLSTETDLYIFQDAARFESEIPLVLTVSEKIKKIVGFKSLNITQSKINKGLANSIIDGVNQVIQRHKKIIVLEDDLIPSTNFLEYMNESLDYYEKIHSVYSVSAFNLLNISTVKEFDTYFKKIKEEIYEKYADDPDDIQGLLNHAF